MPAPTPQPVQHPTLGVARMVDPYVTVDSIAHFLDVSKMTVYRLINAKEIRALKVGRSFRIRRSWVDEYIKRNTDGGAA